MYLNIDLDCKVNLSLCGVRETNRRRKRWSLVSLATFFEMIEEETIMLKFITGVHILFNNYSMSARWI